MKTTSIQPYKEYDLRYTKVQLEVLYGQMVIIKLNTHYSHMNDDNSQYMYHPRMGQVGTVAMVIDRNYLQVKFEDEASYVFPIIQVFFLRPDRDIFTEVLSCKSYVLRKYGEEEYNTIYSILGYSSEGKTKQALLASYNTIFAYHFITYLGCPRNFPEYISDQEDEEKSERFKDRVKQLMLPDMEERQILKDLFDVFNNAPILFRKLVCLDCGYSEATFFRKMRATDRFMVQALSNAEKESILKNGELVLRGIVDCVNKYRKGE